LPIIWPRGPGRIRIRLAERLGQIGFKCDAVSIIQNRDTRGPGSQAVRWDAVGTKDGRRFRVYCWDTMAECASKGLTWVGQPGGYEGEVCADDPA
jgi:hypothetical protein